MNKIKISSKIIVDLLKDTYAGSKKNKFYEEVYDVLFIKNVIIDGNLDLITNTSIEFKKSVHFIDCIFNDWVTFNCLKVEIMIDFMRCSFEKSIIIHDGHFLNGLRFDDCSLSQTIQINDGNFKELRLEFKRNSNDAGIVIMKGNFDLLKIQKCVLSRCDFSLSEATGRLELFDNTIGQITMDGRLSKDSEIVISNLRCKYIEIIDFQNLGKFELFRISCDSTLKSKEIREEKWQQFPIKSIEFLRAYFLDSKFILYNSSFGEAVFNNINFDEFSRVIIKDSNLSKSTFSNIRWFKEIDMFYLSRNSMEVLERIEKSQLKDRKTDFAEKKEIYRQLKLVSYKQNDLLSEQFFHGLEMRSYYKTLAWFSNDFFTKAIIGLSRLTSNFGQSMSRPIICILLGHLVLFITATCLNEKFFNSSLCEFNTSAKSFQFLFEKYFFYINPFRKYDSSFSGYLVLIDLLMRIWSSFMIYNIIRASRRFIK